MAAPEPKPPVARHFVSMDGLRGLACLAVVLHHCYFHAGRYSWPLGLPLVLSYGYLGVEVFFVLSGFCLAYPLFIRAEQAVDWALYARKRAWRILPPYWAALLIFGVLSVFIHHLRIGPFADSPILAVPKARQLLYSILLVGVCYNTSFWTLTVEARWYFAFPVLIGIYRRFSAYALMLVGGVVSLLFVALTRHGHNAALEFWIGPLAAYLPHFGLGICAAGWMARKGSLAASASWLNLCRVGLIASVILVAIFNPPHPQEQLNYGRLITGGLLAYSLLCSALRDPVAQRILCWKPFVNLGLISYSLYLIHLPLVQLAYSVTGRLAWSPMVQFFFYQFVMSGVCIGCGWLLFTVAERPFLRKRVPRKAQAADRD